MRGKKLLAGILSAAMAIGTLMLPVFADDEKGTETNPYMLEEFNKLTDVSGKNLWVNIGDLDISTSSTTLGNYDMSDGYIWVKDGNEVPNGYTATSRRDYQNNSTAYITDKEGATIHITGSLKAKYGVEDINDHTNLMCLFFQLPAKTTVILENMTLNGVFDLVGSYDYHYNMPDGSIAHQMPNDQKPSWATNVWYNYSILINKIEINNCTINGQWFHNGASFKNISIDKTKFTSSENGGTYANNANPIWWQNMPGVESVSITNSEITSTRPIKFESHAAYDDEITYTVKNNTFNMETGDKNTKAEKDQNKNAALIVDIWKNLGNVDISNNTLITEPGVHTQLVGIPYADEMILKEDKIFNVFPNTKEDGTELALTELVNGWKTENNAEWTAALSEFLDNQQVMLTEWKTATDSGYYIAGGQKYGMMRFMFKTNPTGTITESGIMYIKAGTLAAPKGEKITANGASVFQGDIIGIPEGNSGTYYAKAYIETANGTFWSESIPCSVNWNQFFTGYKGGAE